MSFLLDFVDHRGTSRRLVMLNSNHWCKAHGRRRLKRALVDKAAGVLAILCGIVAFFWYWLELATSTHDGGRSIGPVVWACLCNLLAVYIVMRIADSLWLNRIDRAIVDDAIAHHCCAACGNGLAATQPAEPDGCVVCPECGAAWRWEGFAAQAKGRL